MMSEFFWTYVYTSLVFSFVFIKKNLCQFVPIYTIKIFALLWRARKKLSVKTIFFVNSLTKNVWKMLTTFAKNCPKKR